ncbi:quinol:cytochrome c oxidoreductase iron-sulfur protein precursor [Dokdonia sp. Hel_I_63]|uniref:TAT-variant-translocated molybdopterin oxidoreductase n=1 Tax=Dokdonia sp. Hel_I_63 TaxID=1249996 RepID=UPI00119B2DE4|nr:TAT-variant-translocated molybdopterin oxidoreductase [Dokdonia sp. Hel_I_63]TVZ21233.1 quinol:cytochrome c oxidoreductase iron-sulfur protein precursor [Dokdonia sp. Hel_I_63]
MSSNKKYWKSVDELQGDSSIEALRQNEFVQEIPTDEFLGDKETLEASETTRRDFLKYVGFSTAAASLAACEGPVVKSVPYVVQPEQIVPGVADYYATTIADGFDFASVLVKTREGRPIKIENNDLAKGGFGANARVHASVLGMYDTNRAQFPTAAGEEVSWSDIDKGVIGALQGGKKAVLLTQTFASPSTDKLIEEFKAKFPNVSHVAYDAAGEQFALDAFEMKYGFRALPDYDFAKADVIVAVGADFVGDWNGGGYDSAYGKKRVPKNGKMSKHFQFEANMSLSGANADVRVPSTPSQQKLIVQALAGGSVSGLPEGIMTKVAQARKALLAAGDSGLLITGVQDVATQKIALDFNAGKSVMDTAKPKMTRSGDARKMMQLVKDMNAGQVGTLIMAGVNPAYSLPNASEFTEGLKKVDVSVACSIRADETAALSTHIAPVPHYLESWGDVQIKMGEVSLQQPTIKEIFNTRQFQQSLLTWMGEDKTYYEYLKDTMTSAGLPFNKSVQAGVVETNAFAKAVTPSNTSITSDAGLSSALQEGTGDFELTLYTMTSMGDGTQANNPWLQEMPDPLTRCTWDNYLTMSEADAKEKGLWFDRSTFFTEARHNANGGLNGHYANVTVNGVTLENVPVMIQPGQAKGSVGLAVGYGRKNGIQEEMQTGVNAFPLMQNFQTTQKVSIEKVGGVHEFASVQLHNTLMGRGDIVKETTLEIFNTKDKHSWNVMPEVSKGHIEYEVTSPEVDLWDEFDRSIGHHFNLAIDLNACTGCGACVIACHAENNVPVVGKSEIRRSRDMHWLRIDRYYSSEETFELDDTKKNDFSGLGGDKGSLGGFGELEDPAANPQVAFQPIMCQHCNHAPCETVCPVAASAHGKQGQNHMTYNRCVGTRYCANNCPYKVRRFNWFLYNGNDEFDYHMNNDLGRMVINPDVTVRSRGVMEKCSMCIQMTQKTILDAKRDGRKVKDGEFATACSNACTSGALAFGDINDKESEIETLRTDDRMYHLLEHVGTKPNVFYQTMVRNTEEA